MRKVLFAIGIFTLTAAPSWGVWLGNYEYRMPIIISHAQVAETLTDFPVLITEANLPSEFFGAVVKSDVSNLDIAFSDSNGIELCREIVYFNNSLHLMEAWVKIPTLSSTADTTIYMYFGDAAANHPNDAATWSNGFSGVWHIQDAGSTLVDSSPLANSGTAYNLPPLPVNAKIRAGQDFNGTTGYVDCGLGQGGSLNISGNNSLTIETWVKFTTLPLGQFMDFLCKGNNQWNLQKNSANNNVNFMVYDPATGAQIAHTDTGVSTATWYHVVGRYNYAGGGEVALFLNGVKQSSTGTATAINDDAGNVMFGQNAQVANHFLNGVMDEVRIQNLARSDGWIATAYNTENSPGSFYSVGPVDVQPPATPTATATVTFTGTATSSITPSVTSTPTRTLTPTLTVTSTSTKTATPTPNVPPSTPTVTPTVTASATCTPFALNGRGVLAFPNPARHAMNFALDAPRAGNVRVDVFNLKGERIANLSFACQQGRVYLPWDCTRVAAGVYLVRATEDGSFLGKTKVAIISDLW